MPYAATATPVRSIERTSAISPQDMPEASSTDVIPTADALSAYSDTPLSDEAREEAILRCGVAMCNAHGRGDVRTARRLFVIQCKLVHGRSPEYVARLEAERGLA